MAKKKGEPKTGGRTKGTPNKATKEIRERVKDIFENNIDNVQKWLDQTAKRSPARAIEMMLGLAEFCIPKLSRTEVTGDKDAPIVWREEKNYAKKDGE